MLDVRDDKRLLPVLISIIYVITGPISIIFMRILIIGKMAKHTMCAYTRGQRLNRAPNGGSPLQNEMSRVSDHLCAHVGETGPGKPSEDDEMTETTLPSRHRILNSIPGRSEWEETFCFFETGTPAHRVQ